MNEHFWKGFWLGMIQGGVFLLMPAAAFIAGYYTGLWKLLGIWVVS